MIVDDLAFWATAILSILMIFLYMGDCYFVPTYDLFVYFLICGIDYFLQPMPSTLYLTRIFFVTFAQVIKKICSPNIISSSYVKINILILCYFNVVTLNILAVHSF